MEHVSTAAKGALGILFVLAAASTVSACDGDDPPTSNPETATGGTHAGGGDGDDVECPLTADECPPGCEFEARGYAVDEEKMCVQEDDWIVVGCHRSSEEVGACKAAYFCFERIEDGEWFVATGCLDEPEFSSAWRLCPADLNPDLEDGSHRCDSMGGTGPGGAGSE